MARRSDSNLRARSTGGVVVVSFSSDRIREERRTLAALDELNDFLDANQGARVLLDMSVVEYLSSAGLGRLIGLLKRARGRGGSLSICCVQDRVHELFTTMYLDRVFEVFPTVAAGLESLPSWESAGAVTERTMP